MSKKIIDEFTPDKTSTDSVFIQGRIPRALYDELMVEFQFIAAHTGKKVSWPKYLKLVTQRFVEEVRHERLSPREPKEKRSIPRSRRA
jgi:hypothetical protein